MSQPSAAAKAAAILHNTWGVDGYSTAVKLYDLIGSAPECDVLDILESHQSGVWSAIDNMPIAEWWENIETLANIIDMARTWESATGNQGEMK